MTSIEKAILEALNAKPRDMKKESRDDYFTRLCEGLSDLDDETHDALPDGVKKWEEQAIKALEANKAEDVLPFIEFEDTEDDPEPEAETDDGDDEEEEEEGETEDKEEETEAEPEPKPAKKAKAKETKVAKKKVAAKKAAPKKETEAKKKGVAKKEPEAKKAPAKEKTPRAQSSTYAVTDALCRNSKLDDEGLFKVLEKGGVKYDKKNVERIAVRVRSILKHYQSVQK